MVYSGSGFLSSTACINRSNLELFLQCVTPVAPSRFLPKSCINNLNSLWQPAVNNKDVVEYFSLGDLWDCYREWSAYGAGTPILLPTGETITQYYVPYLSAIQIYSNKSVATSRSPRGHNDAIEFEIDSWSEDSMSEKLSRSPSNNSNSSRNSECSFDESSSDPEVSLPIDDRLGYLYFQHFERCSPYLRIPLFEKIMELARDYPGLLTLKNVDLSPASWMAVAWYPIYHIPSRRNEKDLSTCFLTYHTLSSSFQDCWNSDDENEESLKASGGKLKGEGSEGIPLTPFGLATYKLHGNLWFNQETSYPERIMNLQNAADSWLKQLNIQHQDYNFFTYHSNL